MTRPNTPLRQTIVLCLHPKNKLYIGIKDSLSELHRIEGVHLCWLLVEETDVEDWRVGSTNEQVNEGQGWCAAHGAWRVRNILDLKHLGVGGWETEKISR